MPRRGGRSGSDLAANSRVRNVNLNDLLRLHGIDPKFVLMLRHRPTEPRFNAILPNLAQERHDLFNAYQRTQGEKLESAMLGSRYIASFIRHPGGRALFVGFYEIGPSSPLSFSEFWSLSEHQILRDLGMQGFSEKQAVSRSSILRFDLDLLDFYKEWKGRMIVSWLPPERSWWRRAHKNNIKISSILEESALEPPMPDWRSLDISWSEIENLPRRWRERLVEWRGIYLVFDTSDGKSYVGSAYGAENLLGRWLSYGRFGHGGNQQLRQRDPALFRFSILERLSPDMPADEVIEREVTWKNRLHTRVPHGLNDN